jgi:hypothetical protein
MALESLKCNSLHFFLFPFIRIREREELVSQREMLKINRCPWKASACSVQDFKEKHKIWQEHVTRYIINKGSANFEETVEAAELFQKQAVTILPNHCSRFRMWIKGEIK